MKRALLIAAGCLSFAIGILGIAVPVLPTTPLLLLATFLFAKSSPRLHERVVGSKPYRLYVAPFKDAGGMPRSAKAKALFLTYAIMGISAYLVQKPIVWAVLSCCALIMLYIIGWRIPTISAQQDHAAKARAHALETETE